MNTVASTTRGQGAASTNRACATKPWRAPAEARAQAGRLLAPDFLAQQQADDQIAANQRREGQRQPTVSANRPPASWPADMPRMVPVRKRASVACRRS